MNFKNGASAAGIALVVLYAAGSGYWVSSSDSWYRALRAPSWQPPDWVFGVIWPYNFIVLGIAAFVVASKNNKSVSLWWLSFFAISIVFALSWSYYFYVPHRLILAAALLVCAALFTLPLLILTWRTSWKMGIALLPYQLWVAIASTLSIGYAHLN